MKKILVVAPFVSLPGEPQFNRFLYLCSLWAKDYEVTLATSSFCHHTKQQRVRDSPNLSDLSFRLVLLDEPGYQQNVSFARFWSHRAFHSSFKSWLLSELNQGARFDLIYSAFPLISTNLTIGQLQSAYPYKFVIDVQDVWPDSIFAAIPALKAANFLLAPLRAKAHRAYGCADGIVAVSKTFRDVAASQCPTTPTQVTYIGSDYQLIEAVPAQALDRTRLRLVYIGTLSHSYDIATVIKGFLALRQQIDQIELHILGDGPDRQKLENIAKEDVFFHGYLPYKDMVAFVKACDLVINPLVSSSTGSVTNKLSDYIAFGLPILSSQQNPEAIALIKERNGYFFEPGSPQSFAQAAAQAIRDRTTSHDALPLENGDRAAPDALDKAFDRRIAYPKITEFVESL